jgi:hypothetical protein
VSSGDITADARLFLDELYGQGFAADLILAISSKNGGRWGSTSFADCAERALAQVVGHVDVYTRITMLAGRPARRGEAKDSAALATIWAEADINGAPDGRGGVVDGAFESVEQAIGLIARVLEPSMIVISGYGVHFYWLLQELLLLGSDEDRARAKALIQGWQALLRARAREELGIRKLDSTHDLSRVFRPPASFNGKGEVPQLVTLHAHSGARYSLEEVRELIEARDREDGGARQRGERRASRRPLPELLKNFPKLLGIAKREGKAPGDGSGHSWDHYLACEAIRCGLSDSEIAELLRYARSLHPDPKGKGERADYIANTIRAAHVSEPGESELDSEEDEVLSLGQEIAKAWKLKSAVVGGRTVGHGDAAIVYLELADGRELHFPRLADFFDPNVHARRVSIIARCRCPSLSKGRALEIAKLVIELCDAQADPDERRQETIEWLSAFIASLGRTFPGELLEPGEKRWEALRDVRDFDPDPEIERISPGVAPRTAAIEDGSGRLWLPAEKLLEHIRYVARERIDWPSLRARMADIGWEHRKLEQRKAGDRGERIRMSFFVELEA